MKMCELDIIILVPINQQPEITMFNEDDTIVPLPPIRT